MIVRLLIVSALVAATGLAGCGKKGPLEPPKLVAPVAAVL